MTIDARLEREMPDVLGELATGPYPDYIDDVLWATERTRQRSRWTFPERWLPMDLVTQPVRTPGLPWRTAAIGALLLLATVVAVAGLYAGTRPKPAPPFGIARDGLVADDTGGDIRVIDPATETARLLVGGPTDDVAPLFTRDGRGLIFLRRDPSAAYGAFDGDLFWVSVDGGDPIRLTSKPYQQIDWVEASPTGREIAFISEIDGAGRITTVGLDGQHERTFEPGLLPNTAYMSYTPDGANLVFATSIGTDSAGSSLVSMDVASGELHVIKTFTATTRPFGMVQVSPDGRTIAYALTDTFRLDVRLHLIGIDGSNDRELRPDDPASLQAWPQFSPSGRYLLFERNLADENHATPVVVDLTGRTPDVDIQTSISQHGAAKEWSPDERYIVANYGLPEGGNSPQVRWDRATGAVSTVPWSTTSGPSIQRLAP